jgi:hypothetical protein
MISLMTKTSEFRTKPSEPSISAATKAVFLPASHTKVPLNRGGFPATSARELDLEPVWDARCLWCHRIFTPRTTGGSAQRFCYTGHRHSFGLQHGAGRCGRSRRAPIPGADRGSRASDLVKVDRAAVALLTPEFLLRLGLNPQAKVLDLKTSVPRKAPGVPVESALIPAVFPLEGYPAQAT